MPNAKIATCIVVLRNIVIFIGFSLSKFISPESVSPVAIYPVQTHFFRKCLRPAKNSHCTYIPRSGRKQ
jgi:hypothetical protein